MIRGFLRLGLLLTAIWLIAVGSYVGYEHASRNFFCQFDPPGTLDKVCAHYFWVWTSRGSDVLVFKLNVYRVLIFAFGIPAAAWLFGLSVSWVTSGFRRSYQRQSAIAPDEGEPKKQQVNDKSPTKPKDISWVVFLSLLAAFFILVIVFGGIPSGGGGPTGQSLVLTHYLGRLVAAVVIALLFVGVVWLINRVRRRFYSTSKRDIAIATAVVLLLQFFGVRPQAPSTPVPFPATSTFKNNYFLSCSREHATSLCTIPTGIAVA